MKILVRMKIRLRVVTACLAFGLMLFVSRPCMASNEDQNYYVVIKGGIFLPHDYVDATTTAGPAAELAVGYYITPYIGVEGGAGYFQTDVTSQSSNAKFRHEGTPVTVTIKGIHRGENFISSIGIGVGTYAEEVRTLYGAAIVNDKDTVSGYHMSIGYDFHLGERFYGGFEYRFLGIRTAEFLAIQGRSIFTTRFDLSGTSLMGTIGWRF